MSIYNFEFSWDRQGISFHNGNFEYFISWRQICEDSISDWIWHLRDKRWWNPILESKVLDAALYVDGKRIETQSIPGEIFGVISANVIPTGDDMTRIDANVHGFCATTREKTAAGVQFYLFAALIEGAKKLVADLPIPDAEKEHYAFHLTAINRNSKEDMH